MSPRDRFLAVATVAVVLGLAALTLVGALQYEHDSKQFQDSHQEQKK